MRSIQPEKPVQKHPPPSARVLSLLRQRKSIRSDQPFRVEPLSGTNPIFRIRSSDRSWIIKNTTSPRSEQAVSGLFRSLRIPTFEVESLVDQWMIYEDLVYPGLGDWLSALPRPALPQQTLRGLGVAAVQAELIGMRDRNLDNMLFDEPRSRFYLIDYETAFAAGMFDRIMRPKRYFTYLLRRFFFDVIRETEPPADRDLDTLLGGFLEGMLEEQDRLTKRIPSGETGGQETGMKITLTRRQRFFPSTRIRSSKRLKSLVRFGYVKGLSRRWHITDPDA